MNRNYIVLSNKQTDFSFRDAQAFSAGLIKTAGTNQEVELPDPGSVSPPEPKIETVSASKNDVNDFKRDPNVLEYARAIPVKMIKPAGDWEKVEISGNYFAWGIEEVGAVNYGYTGKGINVAVLDTGIDADHEAFRGMDIIQKDFTGEGRADEIGHGTHCAGTIFGKDVNGVRIGVAPNIERGIIGKVLGKGAGSSINIYNAILWALDNEAHVISMSFIFDFPGTLQSLVDEGKPLDFSMSEALEEYRRNISLFEKLAALILAKGALTHGTVLIAASGNQSRRSIRPDYELFSMPPAACDGIISVGAVGRDADGLKVADFSNTNPDISGPGVDILSAKVGGGLMSNSGTSMAAPHVSGVAALIAEELKDGGGKITSQLIFGKLLGNATTKTMAKGFDPLDTGAGVVHVPAS